jgi:putative toxin-antitoxin system antitoxin component (TIGR02293 family)
MSPWSLEVFMPEHQPMDAEQIFAAAIDTFGDAAKATRWMNKPNLVMQWQKPVDLLGTVEGRDLVRTVLGRIEWRIYS